MNFFNIKALTIIFFLALGFINPVSATVISTGSTSDYYCTDSSMIFIPDTGRFAGKTGFQADFLYGSARFAPDSVCVIFSGDYKAASRVVWHFAGARQDTVVTGQKPLPGMMHFFIHDNPAGMMKGASVYASIIYHDLYPGIDLVYEGKYGHLKGSFIVDPGADPGIIRMAFNRNMQISENGSLISHLPDGVFVVSSPFAYQVTGDRPVQVDAAFRLLENGDIGYFIGEYDESHSLVIDPEILFTGIIGGSQEDRAGAIAIDQNNSVYIAGYSYSYDFPVLKEYQDKKSGNTDALIVKMTASGTPVFSSYFGGSGDENCYGIAIDSAGDIYITGLTTSPDFPTTGGDFLPEGNNCLNSANAFIIKLDPEDGSILSSILLGGTDNDHGRGIAIDGDGHVYVTGVTDSSDFPTHDAIQETIGGGSDAFITCLDTDLSVILYSTFLGGRNDDYGMGIGTDGLYNAYVTGYTYSSKSSDFPVKNPLMGPCTSTYDAFISAIESGGGALIYSTYLGGSSGDRGESIAVGQDGIACVTGYTYSADFPVKNAFQENCGGACDAFITRINADGSLLLSSSYLGGSGDDFGYGIATGTDSSVYLAGGTSSSDFPVIDACDDNLSGSHDAFIAHTNSNGSSLYYATFFGGKGSDFATGIAVNNSKTAYITGYTSSPDLLQGNIEIGSTGGRTDILVGAFAPPNRNHPENQSSSVPGFCPVHVLIGIGSAGLLLLNRRNHR